MLSFLTFLLPIGAKSYIEIKTHAIYICFPLNATNKVFLYLGRGVPGRRVPVKKSIWADESRAEMVLGRGVPST